MNSISDIIGFLQKVKELYNKKDGDDFIEVYSRDMPRIDEAMNIVKKYINLVFTEKKTSHSDKIKLIQGICDTLSESFVDLNIKADSHNADLDAKFDPDNYILRVLDEKASDKKRVKLKTLMKYSNEINKQAKSLFLIKIKSINNSNLITKGDKDKVTNYPKAFPNYYTEKVFFFLYENYDNKRMKTKISTIYHFLDELNNGVDYSEAFVTPQKDFMEFVVSHFEMESFRLKKPVSNIYKSTDKSKLQTLFNTFLKEH